ncbi:MAG: sensor histidine kinase [Chloroflexi bacterium]|nr:MAG: sensor histidine kinase [Chloroflexota bacterium]
MRGRPWSWITGRPRLADGVVVGLTLAIGLAGLIGNYYRSGSFAAGAVLVTFGEALPLWWRRRYPVPVLVVIAAVEIVKWASGLSNEPSGAALVFAVYAVSVYDKTVARLIVAGAAIALIVLAVTLLIAGDLPISRNLIPAGALSLVGWVIGDYMRSRRQFFMDMVARHNQERDQAADEERLRIARELHDVVAHNVSVMAIQAGAARVSGNSSKEALQSIESTARDTLAELNRLLGVLRKQSDAPLAPQPGLDQVDALLKSANDAGLETTLKITGEKRPLPAALDLTAYRIVQEAITNALKHAHASRLEVRVAYREGALELTIRDNGEGQSEAAVKASTGHGLIGMRERVELFGGELEAGSSNVGGFTVRSRLPIA